MVLDGRSANQAVIANATLQRAWIAARVQEAAETGADGINFDLEDALNVSYICWAGQLSQSTPPPPPPKPLPAVLSGW